MLPIRLDSERWLARLVFIMQYHHDQAGSGGAPAINNDTISRGGEAGGGGAPAINNYPVNRGEQAVDGSNNDTISHGEEAGVSGAPAINNGTVSRGEQAKDCNYYQQLIKLQSKEIKELKRKLYEQ